MRIRLQENFALESMGGHIIQKWCELTIGDREHDHYERTYLCGFRKRANTKLL